MGKTFQLYIRLLMLVLIISNMTLWIILHNTQLFLSAPRQRPIVLYRTAKNITKLKRAPHSHQLLYNVFNFELSSTSEENSSYGSNWDILMSRRFPFNTKERKIEHYCHSHISPGQKINHFPGIYHIANKAVFNLNGGNKYTPKTFLFPREKEKLRQEIDNSNSKDRVWVRKNKNHRGVRVIKDVNDITLEGNEQILIQEFITNQFLLFDRVINNGIFVLITSAYPLRAYVLDDVQVVRVCNKAFHPVDFNDIETYVTDGGHSNMLISQFSPMERFLDVAYSRKQSLEAYILSSGNNTVKTRNQMYDAIQHSLLTHQKHLLGKLRQTKFSRSHFFEILRYDFILDDDLNVHLIEANMSPDLGPDLSTDNSAELRVAESNHLMYSVLRTIGNIRGHGDIGDHWIRDSDININYNEVCYTSECSMCQSQKCRLCSNCLTQEAIDMLKVSFEEHINRQGFRRVYPQRMTQMDASLYDIESDINLPFSDQINKAWLRAKCLQDKYWCT